MIVTINTDASFSKTHHAGSYAFWIVSNEFKVLKSGVLKNKVARPEIAEFRCIINSLHQLFKEDCSRVKKVIINTDCLNVIHLATNNKPAIKKYGLELWGKGLVKSMNSLIKKSGVKAEIVMRHVKAHTGIGDARSYVNEWCDKEAKLKLREELCNRQSRVITYLLADNGGVSNAEMKKLMPIGLKFEHEFGSYKVIEHLNLLGQPVKQLSKVMQVYCERIYA